MMGEFDCSGIEANGWRQGSVLGKEVAEAAKKAAPGHLECRNDEWLILTSHDCDIANFSLTKEPVVEIIRAFLIAEKSVDKQKAWGRNPRTIHIEATQKGTKVILECNVHDRWTFARKLLLLGRPSEDNVVNNQIRRVLAEWLAKRYIRAAFPTQFDRRWRGEKSKNLKAWISLLDKYNEWIQGIYIRLNTFEEISSEIIPYSCDVLIGIPSKQKTNQYWSIKREEIEDKITEFWSQFHPGIRCESVDVLGTDEITLDHLSNYHRFDADWLSFSKDDEYPVMPLAADLRT